MAASNRQTPIERDVLSLNRHQHPGLGQADAQLLIRRLSDFYRQEFSLNNAEDFAETLSLKKVVLVRRLVQSLPEIGRNDPIGARSSRGQILRAGGFGNILTVDINTGGSELVRIIRGR